jgi:hypothetical protein
LRPKFFLSRLREIGWAKWDPIGLRQLEEDWETSCPDEYDGYLMKAAGMLWNGKPNKEVIDYLAWVEADHMGLRNANLPAITETVAALKVYVEQVRSETGSR